MDEWAINRDRELQRAKGKDVENDNAILQAMSKAGLRHVKYAQKRTLDDLSVDQKQRLEDSASGSRKRAGRIRPDEPGALAPR